ncbi:Activator of 90 kDa heat shock protein ATPase-like 1, partial [Cucurbita argyrosperma subsp. sororia]
MAKFGEGDKRWIVEERQDGTNVHNWHWAETDCLEWSRNFMSKLFSNLPLLDGEGGLFIKTKKVDKVDGEAYVNIRKGKIIPAKEGFKTITLTEKFSCRANILFEILMDDNRWKGFTQSNAKISKEVGGEISIFDGSVTGKNLELEEGKLIVQQWRFGSWPDGIHSTVKLTFDEPEPGVTVVKLVHSDVPEEDRYGNATVVENTERGWRDLIFHKIRAVFGFGM